MARMLGQRLTLLQPKSYHLHLNLEQIQHIADGLIENRKSIEDRSLDLYDSQAMDIFEQLERQDIKFPDVVLGEEEMTQEQLDQLEADFEKAREHSRLIAAKFKTLIDMMRIHPGMNEQKLKICRAGLQDIKDLYEVIFGEPMPHVKEI